MKRTLLPLLALTLFSFACEKKQPETTPPQDPALADAGAGQSGVPSNEPVAEPPPPQDPDPTELAPGVHAVLTGEYDQGISILEPIYRDLRAPSQYRASGLAGGWLAVAHAQIVFENAETPAQYALEMAAKLQDPEVNAVAKLGNGAYLLAQEDYTAARQAFEAATAAAPDTAPGAYAYILHAETFLGTAFGSASNTQLEKPADLDTAKSSYQAALQIAQNQGSEREILMGRAKEGLAAVAKYQRDQPALCSNAHDAIKHYEAAGASNYLLEGPSRLATDSKCDK